MAAKRLTSATEDYLEAILSLVHEKGFARVRDIAKQLGVGRSAVSNALHALGERGLVAHEPYSMVTLTDLGAQAAQVVRHRHAELAVSITDVLGLHAAAANAAACRIEHNIDPAVLARLSHLGDFIRTRCERERRPWLETFIEFCDSRDRAAQAAADKPDDKPHSGSAGADEADDGQAQPKSLADIPPGGTAKILRIAGKARASRRLTDMGLTAGAIVSVVKVAPLGDPMEVTIRGYKLTFRKEQAEAIYVEEL